MMAHVTASALVSENKVLCHPSSTDTLSTSAGTEDHVSMGGWAARKALKVLGTYTRLQTSSCNVILRLLKMLKTV